MPTAPIRATLKSVAQHAGVSLSTASLVFSGKGSVAERTRDRVLAAAAELRYCGPDPLAASLRRGRADIVAVIVWGPLLRAFRDPYAVSVLDGLASVLDTIPTGMLLMAQPLEAPESVLPRVAGTALDAVVFLGGGPADNPLVGQLQARGVPMVGLGAPVDPSVLDIDIDNRACMHAVCEHLTGLGHERIAVLSLPLAAEDEVECFEDTEGHADAAARRIGAIDRIGTAISAVTSAAYPDSVNRLRGIADRLGDDVPVVVAGHCDVQDGADAVGVLLDQPHHLRPTAIIATSDLLAMGVLRAAGDRGLRIPQDLSVTGVDGIPLPWWPGTLTTVVQPGRGKGARAGQAVRELVENHRVDNEVLPTTLRIGTSTGPAPRPAFRPFFGHANASGG